MSVWTGGAAHARSPGLQNPGLLTLARSLDCSCNPSLFRYRVSCSVDCTIYTGCLHKVRSTDYSCNSSNFITIMCGEVTNLATILMGLNLVERQLLITNSKFSGLNGLIFTTTLHKYYQHPNTYILLVSSTSTFYELHNKSYELVHIIKQ